MTSRPPLSRQRYVSTLTLLDLSLALPFITLLPPCCIVSSSQSGGDGARGVEGEEGGGKMRKKRKAEEESQKGKGEQQRKVQGERDRDVKWGQEIQPGKDRLATSAALTEMSPLNGFPVLDAGPPYLISILLGSCSSDDLCGTQNRSLIKI